MKPLFTATLLASLLITSAVQAAEQHYRILIPEMHCESCSAAVTGTLKKRPEVAAAEADIEHHEVLLTLKPNASLSEEKIRALIEASGFTPTEIKAVR